MTRTTHLEPLITVTGERRRNHFRVLVGDSPVELLGSAIQAVVRLILARASTDAGYALVSPTIIYRLRRALNKATHSKLGNTLIETGSGREYRLAIPPEKLAARVLVQPSFFELEARKVISPDEAKQLRRCCQVLPSARHRRDIGKRLTMREARARITVRIMAC